MRRRGESEAAPGENGRGRHAAIRVLLIEDNQDHAALARRALRERGHDVTVVQSRKAGLAALDDGHYDAVALDYQLPETNGFEALSAIQRSGGLPVVMVTGSGSEQVAVAALKRGTRDYVTKTPGYERELVRALELAVEQSRAEAAEAALRTELERRAKTDPLTGIFNRGEMARLLDREMRRCYRYHREFSFALMDVDDFKTINDTRGHLGGDEVLCRLARTLAQSIRSSDATARWGGDEFAVLLAEADAAAAAVVVDRLHRLIGELAAENCAPAPLHIWLSIGFVWVRSRRPELALVLKWADRALYAAKNEGGGRAKFCVLDEHGGTMLEQTRLQPPSGSKEESAGGAATHVAVTRETDCPQ